MMQLVQRTKNPDGSTKEEVVAATCPTCGRDTPVIAGKLKAHDVSHCNGSHMTWKGCSGSGKAVDAT